MNRLVPLEEAKRLVAEGRPLLVAGDEGLLDALPRGPWIGGTIPYFMAEHGGTKTSEAVFLHRLPPYVERAEAKLYGPSELARIPAEYPENGVSFIILPAGSPALVEYAQRCTSWKGLFDRPLVGWVSGVDLDRLGQAAPKVLDGATGRWSENAAAVLHVGLAGGHRARVDIINLFQQGDGDPIAFETEAFEVGECLVGGQRRNLAEYIAEKGLDTRLPLVADYNGAMVNVAFQTVDAAAKRVRFFAPTVAGITYRQAKALGEDYAAAFQREIAARAGAPAFACNRILNYLYGGLEGRTTGGMNGPITFGEVAYILLTQTMVYVDLE